MKNVKFIGEIAREMTMEIARTTKVSVKAIATKVAHALQPVVEEETGREVNDEHEKFMADLLVEQLMQALESYDNKERISDKRMKEAIENAKHVASAVYNGGIVDGSTSLERGLVYCGDMLTRAEMDSFRDRRNETANHVASMIRSIDDPELYYYIESMLPTAIENVIKAAKAHLMSQDEILESIDSIAESIAESIVKDKDVKLLA